MKQTPKSPTQLRQKAEAQHARMPRPEPCHEAELLHELEVHRIELEMQNEQLRQAQVDLEESRNRYVDLYDFSPVGYLTLDQEAVIDEINLTGAALLGVERKKLLRRRFSTFVARKYRDHWNTLFADMLQQGGTNECELGIENGDREHFYARLNCMRMDKEGAAPVVHITFTDVTPLRQAEEAMREWQQFVDCAHWGMSIGSLGDRTIKLANPAYAHMHGYTVEELHGIRADKLYAPESRANLAQYEESLRSAGCHTFECMRQRKDGSTFPAKVEVSAIERVDGKTVYIANVTDITGRKQAEEKLRESQMKFSAIFKKATSALALSRLPNGELADVNEAWSRMFGLTKEEVIGKTLPELGVNTDLAAWARIIAELQQQGSVRNVELTLRAKHGDVHTFLVNADVLNMGGQKYALTTLEDVTEHKRMEHLLRNLAAHLQDVREEEKTSIAREIHDELGGTLTALKMEAYWLAEELPADHKTTPLLKHVESIGQLVDGATSVLRRIITGLRPTVLDDLGLPAAVEWHAAQFQQRTGIACQVNCLVCEGCEKMLDGVRSINLFRIFQEAITNISLHSRASRVVVELYCSDEEISLSVSDNGCGMPENCVPNSNTYGVLGMIERAALMGGEINFDRPPGGGSRVTVRLTAVAEKTRGEKA